MRLFVGLQMSNMLINLAILAAFKLLSLSMYFFVARETSTVVETLSTHVAFKWTLTSVYPHMCSDKLDPLYLNRFNHILCIHKAFHLYAFDNDPSTSLTKQIYYRNGHTRKDVPLCVL